MKTWVALARGSGHPKHGQMVAWLKSTHGMGHGYANFIAKEALEAEGGDDDDLVAAQFSANKADLNLCMIS